MDIAEVARRSGVPASTLRWPGVTASSSIEVRVGDSLTCGPLEHYLTARWGAHTERVGRTWYVPNEHPVWALRRAKRPISW